MKRWSKEGILLADVPGSGASTIDPNARSGNPRHDTRSGKFGGGGGGRPPATPPANVDPVEYARMLDAVREAAREFDTLEEGDIREFLKGRAKAPEVVDIQQFLNAVTEQRKNDIVDYLDQSMRSTGPLKRARRKVRISMPKGYMRKALGSLDEASVGELSHRLEAMGHDQADVDAFFEKRLKPDIHDKQKAHRDAIAASDTSNWKLGGLVTFEDDGEIDDADEYTLAMAERIVANLPQPIVHVHVGAPDSAESADG